MLSPYFDLFTMYTLLFTYSYGLQFRADSSNQWNGNFYGKQGYNGYGYTAPQNQDPNLYAAAAAATAYGTSTNGYGNQ